MFCRLPASRQAKQLRISRENMTVTARSYVPLHAQGRESHLWQDSRCGRLLAFAVASLYIIAEVGSPKVCAQQNLRDTAAIMVNVTSIPASAEVYLDSTFEGVTPLSISVDRKRKHLITVQASEYVTHNQWLIRGADTVVLSIVLKPNYSWLKAKTDQEDTRILVDDTMSVTPQEITRIAIGRHNLRFERPRDDRFIERVITLNPADTVCFRGELGARSFTPVALSIVIPGAGQFYDRARFKGIGFFLGTVAALYLGVEASKDRDQASSEYDDTYALYLKAGTEEVASRLRSETVSRLDRVNSLTRRENWLIGLAASIYAANLIDVFLFHRFDDSVEFEQNSSNVHLSPFVSANPDRAQVGLTFTF